MTLAQVGKPLLYGGRLDYPNEADVTALVTWVKAFQDKNPTVDVDTMLAHLANTAVGYGPKHPGELWWPPDFSWLDARKARKPIPMLERVRKENKENFEAWLEACHPEYQVTSSIRSIKITSGKGTRIDPRALAGALARVELARERYGTLVTDFDTFADMPALLSSSFTPVQDFLATLVAFQDLAFRTDTGPEELDKAAGAVTDALESAVGKAREAGYAYALKEPSCLPLIDAAPKITRIRNQALNGGTAHERDTAQVMLDEFLASLADTLGGTRALAAIPAIGPGPKGKVLAH